MAQGDGDFQCQILRGVPRHDLQFLSNDCGLSSKEGRDVWKTCFPLIEEDLASALDGHPAAPSRKAGYPSDTNNVNRYFPLFNLSKDKSKDQFWSDSERYIVEFLEVSAFCSNSTPGCTSAFTRRFDVLRNLYFDASGRNSKDNVIRLHVFGNDCSTPNHRVFSHFYPGQNRRVVR